MQQIDFDGNILRTIPIIDILLAEGYEGLLYLSSTRNAKVRVSGDTLHLNDVEVFPEDMESQVFEPGDLMMSLRNINAVMVVDPEDFEVKFASVGRVMRQHDPDFLDGDRISVFDNRTFTRGKFGGPAASRIVELNALTGHVKVALDGANEDTAFYTEIMGMHQRLPNGNILVTATGQGRVLEFTPGGRLAWRYEHQSENGETKFVTHAEILPANLNEAFFKESIAKCQ